MFCVECGKESGDALVGGLCHECLQRRTPVASLPLTVDLEVCAHCHSRKRGEIWLRGQDRVEPIVEDAVREVLVVDARMRRPRVAISVVPEDERNFTVRAVVDGAIEGVALHGEASTRARLKNATCLRCSRLHGGYYESVVQVRAQN